MVAFYLKGTERREELNSILSSASHSNPWVKKGYFFVSFIDDYHETFVRITPIALSGLETNYLSYPQPRLGHSSLIVLIQYLSMEKTIITDINQLDLSRHYSIADYLSWQFEEMVELIRGKVVRMAPAPNSDHAEISGNLFLQTGFHSKKKACKIFHAPFDVYLFPPGSAYPELENTVVQPDICVICDSPKIQTRGCEGAPDWVIEILSPATAQKDLTEKYDLYEKARVQEYWVVYPAEKAVHTFVLGDEGQYIAGRTQPYTKDEKVPVKIFPDLEVDLKEVFPEEE